MRKILAVAASAALMLADAALAQPRDTPPPGCRWFGDDLGCKDGRGAYRRAGDDAIIGRYAAAPRLKPKPKPRPVAAPAVTEAPPSAQDLAANPAATQVATDVADASANASSSEGFSMDAPATEAAPPRPPEEPPAPAPVPAKPKPWWQALWDWLVNDFMGLLRRLGLAK